MTPPHPQTSAYNGLILAAAEGAGNLVQLVRGWQTPLREFQADVLSSALGQASLQASSLVFVQIVIDAANLATTAEHYKLVEAAMVRIGSGEVQFADVVRVPEMLQRLTGALERLAGALGDYAQVGRLLADIVEALNSQMAADGISEQPGKALRRQRLGGGSGIRLTPLHVECVRQCVLARRRALSERVAQTVVSVPFAALGNFVSGDRARAMMEFRLYGGMVCASLGSDAAWVEAQRQWSLVFALPGRHTSAIQAAAFKRLTLAHIMLDGSRARLPKFLASQHARAIELSAKYYALLADACVGAKTLAPAMARLSEMRRVLTVDQNAALAEAVIMRLPAHVIRRVGTIYSSIRLGQLADTIDFSVHPLADSSGGKDRLAASLARFIRTMGDPCVVVDDESDGGGGAAPPVSASTTVRFVPARATLPALPNMAAPSAAERIVTEQQWAEAIQAKIAETEQLRERLNRLDRHLALTDEYAANSREQPVANA
ncbi:hypothetical protein BX661DRAFT_187073 [Kickxella alabastrina]|uniref:uncharacterized protein n=1 Tax=Kickxella alabastrina TaxID=61397 RepID=UPI00221F48A2|nr:uncharacterized protein BX661DRAFT_187073 [Kickxella alabastrina]KAI7822741.1 hypothetical protein BX661DRAFT_187073 [Kickxella alabastrina]